IILGPAGIVQAAKLRKREVIREGCQEGVMPTHEYIRKLIEDVSEDDDFCHGVWVSAVEYLNAEGGIVSGYFRDMKTFCQNGKLAKVVVVIKSCTPNALGFPQGSVPGDGIGVGGSLMLDEEELIQMLEKEAKVEQEWYGDGHLTDEHIFKEHQMRLDQEALAHTLKEEARVE
ncbi:hypothetical protein Tco_0814763, partial [Tanacetum coccineum]